MVFSTWKFSAQIRTHEANQEVEKWGMTWRLCINKGFGYLLGEGNFYQLVWIKKKNLKIVLHHIQRAGKERSLVWGVLMNPTQGCGTVVSLTLQPSPLPPSVLCLWGWILRKSLQSATNCRIWVILAVGPCCFPAVWLFGWVYIYGLSHSVLKYLNSLPFVPAGICQRISWCWEIFLSVSQASQAIRGTFIWL